MFEIKINGLQELEKKIARTISGMPEAARRGVEKGLKTTAGIAIRLEMCIRDRSCSVRGEEIRSILYFL